MFFSGVFNHTIDAKGRTSLPARFRELLVAAEEPQLFLIRDPSMKAIRALPLSKWKKVVSWAETVSPFDWRAQANILRFVSSAQDIDLDEHGRVLVPASLRAFAQLQKDVVWTGMGSDMCLWDVNQHELELAKELPPGDVVDPFTGLYPEPDLRAVRG